MTAAEIVYTVDTGEKLVNETFGPNNIRRRTSGTERAHPVEIRDGRPARKEFSLDENGFVLVDHKSAVKDFTALLWSTRDRKSTRLNSSHANISYAVFC